MHMHSSIHFHFFSFPGRESVLSATERHKMTESTKSREDTITKYQTNKGQHMKFRYMYKSHCRPANAQTSLCIRRVSTEPSLLTYTKYGSRGIHLDRLDSYTCMFKQSHSLTRAFAARIHKVMVVKEYI